MCVCELVCVYVDTECAISALMVREWALCCCVLSGCASRSSTLARVRLSTTSSDPSQSTKSQYKHKHTLLQQKKLNHTTEPRLQNCARRKLPHSEFEKYAGLNCVQRIAANYIVLEIHSWIGNWTDDALCALCPGNIIINLLQLDGRIKCWTSGVQFDCVVLWKTCPTYMLYSV